MNSQFSMINNHVKLRTISRFNGIQMAVLLPTSMDLVFSLVVATNLHNVGLWNRDQGSVEQHIWSHKDFYDIWHIQIHTDRCTQRDKCAPVLHPWLALGTGPAKDKYNLIETDSQGKWTEYEVESRPTTLAFILLYGMATDKVSCFSLIHPQCTKAQLIMTSIL